MVMEGLSGRDTLEQRSEEVREQTLNVYWDGALMLGQHHRVRGQCGWSSVRKGVSKRKCIQEGWGLCTDQVGSCQAFGFYSVKDRKPLKASVWK